ncbi:hypothetical protein PLESTB_001212400 [Pleodorina starrii]|uniref:Uncharacterized protein n=1 Tax=Pleodorina starrii TaxID=330485 RepID=A0A9W6F5J8_9CHLO|nr:hypothetical protein PLESTM_001646700 [Pleodorina starrii]GLC57328.1 hypothetical protein PLESTB_001212400 [Pleodorina starrii]GLC71272.1 hypothetical protein PLESTF_001097500 [Pleodorina starrii]
MPKHVILGREHEHHHKDAWHQFEGLVVVLVACHAVAFLFWAWLLYKTRRANGAAAGGGGSAGSKGAKGKASPARKTTPAFEWRTPREILLAQQKAKMGKV